MNPLKIPYSSFFPMIIVSTLIISFLWNINIFLNTDFIENVLNNTLALIVSLFLLIVMIFLIYKALISILNKSAAIILTQQGVLDKTRNILIKWGDIKKISLENGKTTSNLILELIDGRKSTIYLSLVKGSSKQIFDIVQDYFEHT